MEYSEVEEQVEVSGCLTEISETSSGYRYDIKSVSVIQGTDVKSFEHLLVYSFSNNQVESDDYKLGNTIKVYGKAKAFEHPGNPGQFDSYRYYRGKGYAYQIQASRIEVVDNNINTYAETVRQISLRISDSFYRTLPDKDAGMMTAIILGTKSNIDEDDKELFQDNGLIHLLAVSALHVSMICTIVLWLIDKLPVSFVKGRILVIIILCIYGSIAGYGVSCTRAIIMIICSIVAGITGRTYDNISALSLAGIIILLCNPVALFNVDYQLSFGAVIAINITSQIINRFDITSKIILMIVNSAGVSLGIAVFTMPIILMNYYEVPLYSSLLNLIILPLMPVLFVCAFCSGVLGAIPIFVVEYIAVFLAGIVHYILAVQRLIMGWSTQLAYQIRLTGCPSVQNIIIYYCILIVLIIILYYNCHNIFKIISLAMGITVLCFVINYKQQSDAISITTLDVGQGDGIYIEYPDNTNMFIDGGSSDVSSVGKYRIKPYLYYNGRRNIDIWVITHGDSDHYSGFLELLDMVSVGRLDIGQVWLADVDNPGEGYCMIEERLKRLDIPVIKMNNDYNVNIGRCHISCLNPDAQNIYSGENEYSIVLLCEYNNFSALLTGDCEGAGEDCLIDYFERRKNNSNNSYPGISLLKVPHHGSANSLQNNCVELLLPAISIISYGKENKYGHPASATLDKLNDIHSRIYDTVNNGAITVISDGDGMIVDTFRNN